MLNLLRLPAVTRLAFRPPPFQGSQHDLTHRILLTQPCRYYATPARPRGRPRSVVGEPSRPVKRAAKRTAAKASTSDESPAKRKVEAKKKVAAGKKTVAKKKPAAKPKNELTVEQLAAKTQKLDLRKVRDLKKAALRPPHLAKTSAYTMYMKDKGSDLKGKGPREEVKKRLAEHSKAVAAAYKELTPAEVEHFNHLAHTTKTDSQAEYKKWVESHTVQEISVANRARASLRRKLPVRKGFSSLWPAVHDERAAKRPMSSYVQFFVNRLASEDFKNIAVQERTKLIAKEWKALNESEKAKYKKLEKEDHDRYVDEYSTVYGHAPPTFNGGHSQPQAAAAAA